VGNGKTSWPATDSLLPSAERDETLKAWAKTEIALISPEKPAEENR
jgi:hypothetical protein